MWKNPVSGTTSSFSGVTVYLDTNDTGSYVATDPTQTTDSSGNFSFTGLGAGTYFLRQVVPTGYKQTSPSSTPTLITVANKQSVTGQDFIDASTSAVTGQSPARSPRSSAEPAPALPGSRFISIPTTMARSTPAM